MSRRADAHIHLFEGGYQGESFSHRPGVNIDEAALYSSFAELYQVAAALVVGYTRDPWCAGNNEYLATKVREVSWARPVAYVAAANPPPISRLESFKTEGFVGLSMYLFGEEDLAGLSRIDTAVWEWLVDHRWLISVNSRGPDWTAWHPILRNHQHLRLIISHLGLPGASDNEVDAAAASKHMKDVLALAEFPGPRMKLSGFYAATNPGHDYPHRAAWPYVEQAIQHFGVRRLLWGSDFSPHLDWLSFPQTFGLFSKMPFLSDDDRHRIEGHNLLDLFDAVVTT